MFAHIYLKYYLDALFVYVNIFFGIYLWHCGDSNNWEKHISAADIPRKSLLVFLAPLGLSWVLININN